jgi:hypothetical protein
MRRSRTTKPIPISIKMIAGLLAGLLFAILAVPLGAAQPASETRTGHGFGVTYDRAHELTLSGDVQQVVTRHVAGVPGGMHLLVAGPKGLVDAHIGPFLSKEMKEALHTGTPVRIVGAMATLNGREYLLARELTVGGTTLTIRGEHGFLRHSQITPAEHSAAKTSNGGAR